MLPLRPARSLPAALSRLSRPLVPLLLLGALLAVLLPAPASAAPAPARLPTTAAKVGVVLQTASSLAGTPYVAAGTSPLGFDCSGFTQYVFARVGVSLVHSSAAQYARAQKIDRSEVVPGDLVFFRSSSGRIYHVAIYAGGGRIWHAQRTGTPAGLTPIWSRNWVAARVL